MARSSTNTDVAQRIRVKEEKIRVKEEKSTGKHRARAEEEDAQGEDEDGEGQQYNEEEEHEEGGSPRGSKRQRVNGDGDSVPSGSQIPHQPKIKTQPRGDDGYIPGSIVRIQLHNFVTYDYVEFFPGPYLNMIIGPNGTGKSSIACAIALGLNFPPAILGRATELNSYVKNGENGGYIEIELKGPKGKKNLVVRRTLNANSRTSTFTLNGKSASGGEIKTQMAELNVQVGNLCSFLPQDRVTEFAAMSSQELLRETQRAAGDENLTNWHDTLISAGKDLKEIQEKIRGEEASVKQMQERNEGIELQVQRYKERKEIEHRIYLLEVLIPVAEYRDLREKYVKTKADQRAMHAEVQRLKDKNAPAHNLLKKYEALCKQADREREELKKSTQNKFKKLGMKNKASEELESESADIIEKLDSLKREEKNRNNQIKRFEEELEVIKNQLATPPPADLPTEDEIRADMVALTRDKNKYTSRKDEVEDQMRVITTKRAEHQSRFGRAAEELKKQDNEDDQKLAMMLKWDKDTHDAIIWVRENRNLFKMEVFETPFMRLSVKDKRYTDALEGCFSANQLKSFITQCQEDCDIINHHINDEKGLGRTAQITTWFRPYNERSIVPPPMSPEEMRALNFDGYALDFVDYPRGMEWFLKRETSLHRTAIAKVGNRVDVTKAMEMVARPGPNHPGGATFINGNVMNIVTRSRYGKRAVGNMTRDIRPARNLTTPTIDPELKRRIDAAMQEAQQGISLCEEDMQPLRVKANELDNENNELNKRTDDIKKRRDRITAEVARVATLKSKFKAKTDGLEKLRKKPSADEERMRLNKKLRATTLKRMQFARDYTDLVHAIISEQQECTRVGLKYLQVCANKAALQELCDRKDAKYQEALVAYNTVHEIYIATKAQTQEALGRSRAAAESASEEVRKEYEGIERSRLTWENAVKEAEANGQKPPVNNGIETWSTQQLEADMNLQNGKLEINNSTNGGIVNEYEKRKRDIEQLEQTLVGRRKTEEKIARNIKNARDNWQPALQNLVNSIGAKFSAAFDRIGCAGEIRISEHEDFDKWAIDILVKFRDSEKLQLLTAHRQSGGERSLTTILYLMSLTEEARAPFSLVDEINQGMDQRAERMVHNSMVEVTCKEEAAQYFLITPKLLPDLQYHARMKILCVNNGEWLPEERDIGRMMDMIDVFEASRPKGGRNAM